MPQEILCLHDVGVKLQFETFVPDGCIVGDGLIEAAAGRNGNVVERIIRRFPVAGDGSAKPTSEEGEVKAEVFLERGFPFDAFVAKLDGIHGGQSSIRSGREQCHVHIVIDVLRPRLSYTGPDLEFVDPTGPFHPIFLTDPPCHGTGREVAGAVSLGKLRRGVGTAREGEQIPVQ